MDLKRLRYYCAIVEQGSISRAAEVLNISQPPLGQRLKELEETLGAQLIVRDNKRWYVTEAGRMLYDRARHLLHQLEGLEADIRTVVAGSGVTVSLGTSTPCFLFVQRALDALRVSNPGIHYRIVLVDSGELERYVKLRALDFAVVVVPPEESLYDEVPVAPVGFSAIFGTGLPAPPKGSVVTLDDLQGLPLLLHRRWGSRGVTENLVQSVRQQVYDPSYITLESSDVHCLLSCIANGMEAVAILPSSEVPALYYEHYAVRRFGLEGLEIKGLLIRLKDRPLSPAAWTVWSHLTEWSPPELPL